MIRYGSDSSQVADLHLPGRARPPVVCLLHGGFWRLPYGRDELAPVAANLAARGFAVWNLEYRRLGSPGGGWPGTFDDVAAGIDHLAELSAASFDLDLDRVVTVGHSAGGHLALWAAARGQSGAVHGPRRVLPVAAAGLAPISDLARLYDLDAGRGAVGELLGGSPVERPERYAAASPTARLPLGVPQLVLHGEGDDAIPIAESRRYAELARAAGDRVELVELPRAGHMDFLDPSSAAHEALCRWLATVV